MRRWARWAYLRADLRFLDLNLESAKAFRRRASCSFPSVLVVAIACFVDIGICMYGIELNRIGMEGVLLFRGR